MSCKRKHTTHKYTEKGKVDHFFKKYKNLNWSYSEGPTNKSSDLLFIFSQNYKQLRAFIKHLEQIHDYNKQFLEQNTNENFVQVKIFAIFFILFRYCTNYIVFFMNNTMLSYSLLSNMKITFMKKILNEHYFSLSFNFQIFTKKTVYIYV